MEEIDTPSVRIEKEQIPEFSFPNQEVLTLPELINERMRLLELAARLGNNHKGKVRIVFEDAEGLKEVKTTIWAATQKNAVLKKGIYIPVHRIHSVKIY